MIKKAQNKTCLYCSREFYVKKCKFSTAKFCSRICLHKYNKEFGFSKERLKNMSKAAIRKWKNPNFKTEGKKFWYKKNHKPWNKGTNIRSSFKTVFKKGKNHINFGKRGKDLKHFKTGKHKNKQGYILLNKRYYNYSDQDGYISEHIYKMEKKLGRKLRKDEVVHHKDGNKSNNKISNLMLLTKSIHGLLHNLAYKYLSETNQINKYIKWFNKNV